MAAHHPIEPFPQGIDRNYFAAWLSGFVDGEGCFHLALRRERLTKGRRPTVRLNFLLALRADDSAIIKLIQSFFQCGRIHYYNRLDRRLGKPSCHFVVDRIGHLRNVIVPHFTNHPLLAKKRRDFAIWKEAVEYVWQAVGRRRGRQGGTAKRVAKWTEAELDQFEAFEITMRKQREFQVAEQIRPAVVEGQKQPSLFDNL